MNSNWITKWKSKGLSNDYLVVSKIDNTLTPSVNYYGKKIGLKFTGSILQQKVFTYSHKKVVNLYVVYEITNFHGTESYPALANPLFGAFKLAKNFDIDMYRYFGYEIGFGGKEFYSHPSGRTVRIVIIFGTDMSASAHVNNKGKNILVLGKSPTEELGKIFAEKCIRLILPKLIQNFV